MMFFSFQSVSGLSFFFFLHSQLLPPPPPPPLPSVFVCSSKVYSYSLPTVLCNENLPWLSTSGTAENALFFKAPRLRNRLFDVRSANPPPVCSLTSCRKTQTAHSVIRGETLRQQGAMFSAPQTPNAGNGRGQTLITHRPLIHVPLRQQTSTRHVSHCRAGRLRLRSFSSSPKVKQKEIDF